MPIEFRCVHCQKLLRVGDDAVGKKARCPDCGTIQEARSGAGGSLTGFSPSTESAPSPPVTQPMNRPQNPFSEQASPGSPFGQSTSNPYLSPQTPGGLPPATREMIQAKVRTPATAMLVVSGLMLAIQLIIAVVLVVVAASGNGRPVEVIMNVIGVVIGMAVSAVIVLGAMKMRQMESYGLAMTAAVLSMLPCTSGCCLISMPFGIWSLIVLLDPQVKQFFR